MATTAVAKRRAPVPAAFRRAFSKRRHHGRSQKTISVAVVTSFIPYVKQVKDGWDYKGVSGAMGNASKIVGYDGNTKTLNMQNFKESGGYVILAGIGVHYAAEFLGVNKMLAKSFRKIPVLKYIRI